MAANSHLHITVTPPAHPKQKLNFEKFHASLCRAYKWQLCFSIDKVGKSKHNKTLLRNKESKDRQHVSDIIL